MITVGDFKISCSYRAAINDVLYSNQISPGPKVREFEEAFAKRHGAKYGVMMNSGTDALRLALAALKEKEGWKDGDEVIVPSVTFVATLNVVLQVGLKPRVIDVGMYDFTLNPERIEWELTTEGETNRIKAVIPVHLCGAPADMDPLLALAQKHGWRVIEDSCETMGVCYKGKPVGSFGDVACFSTYMAHLITTGVGGLAITSDPKLEEIMRSLVNHGRDPYYIPGRAKPPLTKKLLQARYKYLRLGYSSRPTEFEAALGLEQLKDLDKIIKTRQFSAKYLTEHLAKVPGVHRNIQLPMPIGEHAFMMYPMVLREDSPIDKWDLCLYLEENGIETRELLPLTNQPCYRGFLKERDYPMARHANKRGFYIGCHQYLQIFDLDKIIETFRSFFTKAGKLKPLPTPYYKDA